MMEQMFLCVMHVYTRMVMLVSYLIGLLPYSAVISCYSTQIQSRKLRLTRFHSAIRFSIPANLSSVSLWRSGLSLSCLCPLNCTFLPSYNVFLTLVPASAAHVNASVDPSCLNVDEEGIIDDGGNCSGENQYLSCFSRLREIYRGRTELVVVDRWVVNGFGMTDVDGSEDSLRWTYRSITGGSCDVDAVESESTIECTLLDGPAVACLSMFIV